VTEDVIRAKRIEIEDEQGNLSAFLYGGQTVEDEEGSRAGMGVSLAGPDGSQSAATVTVDRETGTPAVFLYTAGGGSIVLSFDNRGRAVLKMENEDGTELTITPGM
jgi:hypothetical protein